MGGWKQLEGGACAPKGFLAAGVSAGVKSSGKRDVAVLFSERDASAAAVFTTNRMAAAPIVVSRRNCADGNVRCVVANSGNANACTGERGLADAESMARAAAEALGVPAEQVAVASTGVIGVPLPVSEVLGGIADAADELDADGQDAAEAIMTTDTFPKQFALEVTTPQQTYAVGGMAKGSGMIRPDMATMLAFLTTDAPLSADACGKMLSSAVDASFHRISVDGETSTNDMVLLLANGAVGGEGIEAGSPAYEALSDGLAEVCRELARMIVRDGEGATKLVTIEVRGAADDAQARTAALAVADSPLFKCAVFGGDPNWGRVVSAIGASGVDVDPALIEVRFAGEKVCEAGTALPFDEDALSREMRGDELAVEVDLRLGTGAVSVWTCDMTYDYVRINAEYRS